MSSVSILDASAVLAYLQGERGHERVEVALDAGPCWLTAVNLCEVLGKLCDHAMPLDAAQAAVAGLGLSVVDFDAELAGRVALLRQKTKSIGASLGDRACLALAGRVTAPEARPVVYTAEKSWTKLKWPFKIVAIR